ncbi:hypothetical protein [Vibrio splendidus]|uniref:hypothetical protein n=1 Tax=Vibrio splendidus TaxID=29497 RepID=UPI0012FE3993|nr:hypothetical protein [Vibrio splendidus]
MIAIFPIIFSLGGIKISIKSYLLFLIGVIFLIAYVLVNLSYSEYSYRYSEYYFDMNLIRWYFISLLVILLFYDISYHDYKKIIFSIGVVIAVFGLIILIQTISHYLFFDLDFYKILGGTEPQRAYDGSLYRPGGLFLEPGTYGVFVGPFVLLYCFCVQKLNRYNFLALLSLFLTFSSFAHYYLILSLLSIYRNHIFKSPRTMLISGVLVVLFLLPVFYYTFERFTSLTEASGTIDKKLSAYNYLFRQSNERILNGIGIGFNDCQCLYADTGLWYSSFYLIGIYSFLVVLAIVCIARYKKGLTVLLLAPLLTKIELHHPALWLYLFAAIHIKKYEGNR